MTLQRNILHSPFGCLNLLHLGGEVTELKKMCWLYGNPFVNVGQQQVQKGEEGL